MQSSISFLTEALIGGFILGLSTGPICMGTCLPLMLPFSLQTTADNSRYSSIFKFLGQFISGRFISYLLFGLSMGYLGSIFYTTLINKISLLMMFLFALLLIVYGLGFKFSKNDLCKSAFKYSKKKSFPFILGILTGINFCPPFMLATLYSFERSATPFYGVSFFMAFFIATSLYLLPIVLVKKINTRYLMKASKITAIIAGFYFIYRGVLVLI